VNGLGRQQPNSAMMMLSVIPGEEGLTDDSIIEILEPIYAKEEIDDGILTAKRKQTDEIYGELDKANMTEDEKIAALLKKLLEEWNNEDEIIKNYQCVVPSTWNAGPRDAAGQPGAYEAALADNHTLHDVEQPVEILRTIHSFDPCIACAVHLTDPDGEEITSIKVR